MVNLPRLAIGMDPLSKHIDESDAHLSDFRGSYTLDHEERVRAGLKIFLFGVPNDKGI